MKRLNIFECAIIGFFVGVIVAAACIYFYSSVGSVGSVLSTIALLPVLSGYFTTPVPPLEYVYIFVVLVFTFYGAIAGVLIKIGKLSLFSIIVLAIVIVGSASIEEIYLLRAHMQSFIEDTTEFAGTIKAKNKTPEQYFGVEAVGDLNADGKDDVAFIVQGYEKNKKVSSYVAASLKSDTGHTGTNLQFLGDTIVPARVSIEDGTVAVWYYISTGKEATSTKAMFFRVSDGILQPTK